MSELSFRVAQASDAAVLRRLLAFLASPGEHALDDSRLEDFFARVSCYPSYRVFLVEQAGVVVGTYSLIILDNPGHQGKPLAVVENVVVDPTCQGCGLGRQMMEHARTCAREAGCYKLMLSSNLVREEAHAFYDRLGFERHGYSFRISP